MSIKPAFKYRIVTRFFFLVTVSTTSFGQTVWEIIDPLPQEENLYSVTFGSNRFVAVGKSGTVLVSPDGLTWSNKTSGITRTLNFVTWGNNQFVAVGDSSTIITSPDGEIWSMKPTELIRPTALLSATFGNDRFVAVGKGSVILSSVDGASWTVDSAGKSEIFESVTFGNNQFAIVGWYGVIFTSPDGNTWTKAASGTTDRLLSVVYAQGQFIATGLYCIYSSTNGATWSMKLNPTSYLLSVTFGNGQFVTVGEPSREGRTSPIFTSTNGAVWAAESSWTPNSLNGVVYGNDRFVAVGNMGTILTSKAGNSGVNRKNNSRKTGNFLHIRIGSTSVFAPLTYTNNSGPLYLQLFSVSGKTVFSAAGKPERGRLCIPVNDHSAGAHVLKVTGDDGVSVFPVYIAGN